MRGAAAAATATAALVTATQQDTFREVIFEQCSVSDHDEWEKSAHWRAFVDPSWNTLLGTPARLE
jgi:hypothetical protein